MANAPSTSQVLAIFTLLPVGGTLLGLAAITFVSTVICLAVTAPLFIIFSPVIVPAALTIGLAVTGVIASEAFGISGLSSLSWLLSLFMRTTKDKSPDGGKGAKPRVQMELE
ncbi:oleosin-like [Apium graveolens]|uniref:oleosin-like n=1 Tax=Apium graveolens TaxID=4045 RepID=UPI003D7A3B93